VSASTSAAPPPPEVSRVLIVDDNVDLVDAVRVVLERAPRLHATPLEVRTASTGAEALEIAGREGFDVAIVDVKLPDASGVDLIRPLREACPGSEVALITGFASMDAAIGALRAGAFALILKTFRPEELIANVEQALTKVRLQREREALERRIRALVELTDVLVVGLDAEGRVVLCNQKVSAVRGLAAEQVRGQPFLEGWIAEEDRPRMRDAIARARGASDRPRDVEADLLGEPRLRVRWHLSGEREHREGLVYGIGIDVTERRALEKRAADAEALSAMGALALNLAHEIRNPLNAAVLQLHLLRRQIDKLDADAETRSSMHRRAGIVGDEIARLSHLLTDFLELARPREVAREPVHLGELVGFVLDLEREQAAARGVAFVTEIPVDGCVAIADAAKLKQVVINLVVNAVEAMKGGGTLTARVRPEGERISLEIEDTGPGIEPEVLKSVFDPFFTTKEAGTGLGLSIVRKIAQQHGGDVRIDTERGRGTRVTVTIPTGR
jgi:PAS domain S-box-containing protein